MTVLKPLLHPPQWAEFLVESVAAKPPQLLDRDSFRAAVFEREGNRCVICGRGPKEGQRIDADHIMERRLFVAPAEFGGYSLDK